MDIDSYDSYKTQSVITVKMSLNGQTLFGTDTISLWQIGVSADMSFPHLNQIAQLPPGISPTQFAGFPTTVPTGMSWR